MDESENIFKKFKEHSIAEFFKKNRQMLGFSGKVRSLTTIIHEYVTNSLDACEEARVLPEIKVVVREVEKERYRVKVEDNGPGIPKQHLGKALGMMLAGTKFHRFVQQRGQQGIGAAGCTMYAILTTGKKVEVITGNGIKTVRCKVGIDFQTNKPVMEDIVEEPGSFRGVIIEAEFADVKYENSVYGVREYLKRTVLANPHASITLVEPNGNSIIFPRSIEQMPPKPHEVQPHPLGIGSHDLLDFAKNEKKSKRISSFLQETFSRMSAAKVNELKELLPDIDFNKNPNNMTWEEAEKIVKAFKQIKWIAPATDSIIPIGKEQIEKSMRNVLNPEIVFVTERSPKVYSGGIPFCVEVGIGYGGNIANGGEIMRFANRTPLLFDSSGCVITETVKNIEWKRYDIKNFEEEPVALFINISSVHIPYTGAGKQAIAYNDDITEEIKNAVMEAARGVQRYLSGKRRMHEMESKRKVIFRYINELSKDLAELSNESNEADLRKRLIKIVEEKYLIKDEDEVAAEKIKEGFEKEKTPAKKKRPGQQNLTEEIEEE